jgi:hypothetical protein
MVFRIKGKFYSYLTNLRPLYCTTGHLKAFGVTKVTDGYLINKSQRRGQSRVIFIMCISIYYPVGWFITSTYKTIYRLKNYLSETGLPARSLACTSKIIAFTFPVCKLPYLPM